MSDLLSALTWPKSAQIGDIGVCVVHMLRVIAPFLPLSCGPELSSNSTLSAYRHSMDQGFGMHMNCNCLSVCDTLKYTTIHYKTLQYCTIHYRVKYSTLFYWTATACQCVIVYNTLQYTTIHYHTLQYSTVLYNTLQYCTVCNTLQYSTIFYNSLQSAILCLFEHIFMNANNLQSLFAWQQWKIPQLPEILIL